MANSGIYWIDITFDYCVRLLYQVAGMMGITYEEINVWLFVVILPAIMLSSFTLNLYFMLQHNQTNFAFYNKILYIAKNSLNKALINDIGARSIKIHR